jgi:hypothetical protein
MKIDIEKIQRYLSEIQSMVLFMAWQCRSVRQTFRRFKDFKLRFGDTVAVLVNPSQGVVIFRRFEIDKDTIGISVFGLVGLCRIDYRR